MSKKLALLILDGWGEAPKIKSNAIANSKTPFVDSLYKNYPHAQLLTSGENVGLPDGQMGNSEVGHMNIGAGRIVWQELAHINSEIRDHKIDKNKTLLDAFAYAKQNNKPLHFIGLVSDGGVHSHINHLKRLCELAEENGVANVFVHAFTDGRDTDPKSGLGYIKELQQHFADKKLNTKIATVCGRYYAMDRDKRWERVKLAYDMLVHAKGNHFDNAIEAIESSYSEGVTDEFIKPVVITDEKNQPLTAIEKNDCVICFNFRTDRCREITTVLTQKNMPDFEMKILPLYYVTMTRYDETFQNVHVMYEKDNLVKTLGEALSAAGKSQIRIAETEKYPHVTFFFSGGREAVFEKENRIMIPSPKVATYDLKPSMSAIEVKDAVVAEINKGDADFICLNFANADMVGHTGVYTAVVEAVETVDKCAGEVVTAGLKNGYSFIIIADHGNADYMINDDGSPNTAHSLNPVPIFVIDSDVKKVENGILADVSPTILKIMNVEIPKEMTGKVLVS
ncbi:MAG: 2,3-bisphosphoglycerate-independent phosphoglycerate mutase [Bacteroidia bacterium]